MQTSIIKNELRIDVIDFGRGIPDADQRQIFEPFYRTKDAVDAQISGSGLGLSLVETNVELHDGRIEVQSTLGKGSTFSVFLPIAEVTDD